MTSDDDEHKRIIDAANRFRRANDVEEDDLDDLLLDDPDEAGSDFSSVINVPTRRSEEESAAWRAARHARLEQDARDLEAHLRETARLSESDRRSIARNLGRLVERRFHGEKRAVVRRLFERAYGEDAAIGMDKKRRRYLRFDGEPLPSNAPSGEYNARGVTFLNLYEAWLAETGETPGTEAACVTLIALCERTSFASERGPRLASSKGGRERFEECMAQLIDRIAAETDVIDYFSRVRRNRILSYPENLNKLTPEQIEQLRFRRWLPKRFELFSSSHPAFRLISDSQTFFVPDLLPQIRVARIYCPRQTLVLPIGVDASQLDAVMRVSAHEQAAAIRKGGRERDRKSVLQELREKKKQDCLRGALEANGLDPDAEYWSDFVDPVANEALDGAEWRRFYQIYSFDLVLEADTSAENLRFSLQTRGNRSHAANTLCSVEDDLPDAPELEVEWARHGEIVTLPVDDKLMICRPLRQETEGGEIDFDDLHPPLLAPFLNPDEEAVGIETADAWQLLSTPMANADREGRDFGARFPKQHMPCMRPCFSAPEGWAPAPEGSLASALMRSLAHGEGSERLDNLLREAIAARINCLADLHARLEREFQAGMRRNGYEV